MHHKMKLGDLLEGARRAEVYRCDILGLVLEAGQLDWGPRPPEPAEGGSSRSSSLWHVTTGASLQQHHEGRTPV